MRIERYSSIVSTVKSNDQWAGILRGPTNNITNAVVVWSNKMLDGKNCQTLTSVGNTDIFHGNHIGLSNNSW